MAVYLVGDLGRRTSPSMQGMTSIARPLALTLAATVAISLLNPFGMHALLEPFRYAFELRREPMFRGIGELMPLDWNYNLRNGLPLMMALWLVLLVWRIRRRRFDLTELLLFGVFTTLTILSRRLVGMWVIVAIPRATRHWASAARRWPPTARPRNLGTLRPETRCARGRTRHTADGIRLELTCRRISKRAA